MPALTKGGMPESQGNIGGHKKPWAAVFAYAAAHGGLIV
jgi:hypothetical protein